MPNPDWAETAPYGYHDDPLANWMNWYEMLYDAIDYARLAAWAAANPTGLTGPFAEEVPIDIHRAYASGTPLAAAKLRIGSNR